MQLVLPIEHNVVQLLFTGERPYDPMVAKSADQVLTVPYILVGYTELGVET